MAKRYRTFKRITMTPKTAEELRNRLVQLTFDHHYMTCGGDKPTCIHTESGSLDVARMLEPAIHIGKRRARLDLPDNPRLIKILVKRLRAFAKHIAWAGKAFNRIADEAEVWAARSPLERLAEVSDG
jgi:hypothetical protein